MDHRGAVKTRNLQCGMAYNWKIELLLNVFFGVLLNTKKINKMKKNCLCPTALKHSLHNHNNSDTNHRHQNPCLRWGKTSNLSFADTPVDTEQDTRLNAQGNVGDIHTQTHTNVHKDTHSCVQKTSYDH